MTAHPQAAIVAEKEALRDIRQGVYDGLKAVLDAHSAKKTAAELKAAQAAVTAFNSANIPATNA